MPLLAVVAGGCCQAFPLPGEADCPTDARRIYCGAGEEAVRRGPCGPDRAFYGHKPTEWRYWPEGWRYGQYPCSAPMTEPMPEQSAAVAPKEADTSVSNPFRNQGGVAELPPASATPNSAPTGSSAADSATPSLAERGERAECGRGPGTISNESTAICRTNRCSTIWRCRRRSSSTDASAKPSGEAGPVEPTPENRQPSATHDGRPTSDGTALPKLIAAQGTPLDRRIGANRTSYDSGHVAAGYHTGCGLGRTSETECRSNEQRRATCHEAQSPSTLTHNLLN